MFERDEQIPCLREKQKSVCTMKKILFITASYFPHPKQVAACLKNVMSECRKSDFDVYCISGTYYETESRFEVIDGVEVYKCNYSCGRRLLKVQPKKKSVTSLFIRFLQSLERAVLFLKKLTFPFCWPFFDHALSRRLYSKANQLHAKHKFDAMVAAFCPFESINAGYHFAKKHKEVSCFFYYLDAFSGRYWDVISPGNVSGKHRYKFLRLGKLFFFLAKRIELKISRYAAGIIVMESARNHFVKNFSNTHLINKIHFLGIPRLENKMEKFVSSSDCSASLFTEGKMHFLYAGNLYGLRDPSYIVSVAKNLNRSDVEFVFIGSFCQKYSGLLRDAMIEYPDRFKIAGRMSYEEIEKYMAHADFLLNIEDNIQCLTASKIIDYVSYGKPIITNAYSSSDPSVKLLTMYGNSLVLFNTDEISQSVSKLNDFVDSCLGQTADYKDVQRLFYTSTPGAFVDVLNSVLSK